MVFLCAAREQALSHLVDKPGLHLVLDEVPDTGVERGDIVCVDEDGLTADVVRKAISAYSANEFPQNLPLVHELVNPTAVAAAR